ncbi:MAG: hypothetical protein QXJ55_03685, partial [Candidatus Caldarchaeum sp.]
RTPSSLSYLLAKYRDITFHYVAPPQLQIREEVLKEVSHHTVHQHSRLEEIRDEVDVLYVTRLQKERLGDENLYQQLRGSYVVTVDLLKKLKKIPLIMHPLPRVDELPAEVDALPQAKYFQQAENGVYVRAALLTKLLNLDISSLQSS